MKESGYIEQDFEFFDSEEDNEFYNFTPNLAELQDENYQDDADIYDFAEAGEVEYDDLFSEIDFSSFSGKFRPNLKRTIQRRTIKTQKRTSRRKKVDIPVNRKAHISTTRKTKEKISIPADRKVIIEGVNSFMLDNSDAANSAKEFGYLNGKKLKTMVITFNNDTLNDFTIDLFNPSFPLEYLHSTTLNINDKVKIAGGAVSYTDVLFNILANPLQIYQAKFNVAGVNQLQQINQPLIIQNRNVAGVEKIQPFQMQLNVDIDQNQSDMIYFNLPEKLNRPFIPDGMDTIQYKVLAGSTCTFGFYYTQVSLKKFFYKDAYLSKGLL